MTLWRDLGWAGTDGDRVRGDGGGFFQVKWTTCVKIAPWIDRS